MRDILSQLIDDFLERDLPVPIRRDRRAPEVPGRAVTVVGMRRVGKTWFCYQRMQDLLARGVPKQRLLYLNFEDDRLLEFQSKDFQTILDVYFGRFPSHKDEDCHLFLDEAQRIEGWEMFVRRVLDTERMSVWITGSSSKLLSKEIASSLRGRSFPVELFPLSFSEFLRFQRVQPPPPGGLGAKSRAVLRNMAGRYLEWGGFPEVQFSDDRELRHQILRNHMDVVLLRDIVERHSVSNVVALRRLIAHVLSAPATRFSVNKFYNHLRGQGVSCSKDTLHEYLDHLSDAYLLHQASIHSRSEKARQVNPKKIYISDSGLIDAMAYGRGEDRGAMLENTVYAHLRGRGLRPEYLVTGSGSEVDFLVPGPGEGDRQLVQVCWTLEDEATRRREVGALKEAMEDLRLGAGTIVTWEEEGRAEEGIQVVPAYRWLLDEHSGQSES